jgi:hypothetical protein
VHQSWPPKFFLQDVRNVELMNPSTGWLAIHEQLVEVISEYDFQLEIVPRGGQLGPVDMDGIYIGKHTRLQLNNCWNLKKAYIPHYFYFDRTGFAGWAEIANNASLFKCAMEVDVSTADEFFRKLYAETVVANLSKEVQSSDPFMPPPRPFVFLPLQLSFDNVIKLSRVDHYSFYVALRDWTADLDLCLAIKPHPFAFEGKTFGRICESTMQILNDAMLHEHVYISYASIHYIIPMSEAVACINSGVGFEALIHHKSVITAGHSDYHWAAHQISSVDDLAKIGNWRMPLLSDADVKKFLCFFLCDYLVDIRDPRSIYKCIDRAVDEYKAGLLTGEA